MKKNSTLIDHKEKIKNKIIEWITTSADSPLIVAKPAVESNSTADLVVEARSEYEINYRISLKIQNCQKKPLEKFLTSSVDENEIALKSDFYFLFIFFDIISQDIFEYIWLIPAEKFFEIADKKRNIATFETPLDINGQNKYSRYLINKKDLGKILTKIIQAKGPFVFPQAGFSGFEGIKTEDIKKFIIDARRNTLAGNGAPADSPRLMGSKELEYQKGDWGYKDIYFSGKDNLIGQEIVYHNNNPIWSMGYFGDQMPKDATEFLKYALLNLADKCRLGGRCRLEKKGYNYEDIGTGSLEKFSGQEIIKEKNTYKLNYYGGLIKK